jgi:hydroxyquinol 1,2-dioxygenase
MKSVAMTVIELNHGTANGATEATLLGPFYIPDAPELAKGAAVCGDPPGEPLNVMGEVQDLKGKPIANALIDVWQAGDDGLYSSQDPHKQKFELRGRFRSDRDGTYHFKSVQQSPISSKAGNPNLRGITKVCARCVT